MKIQNEKTKQQLMSRLRRIEGQVRGVQNMLNEERECREILQQLAAIRSAVQSTSSAFLEQYAEVHGRLDRPVLVGVLPLVSLKHANFLHHEVPGISIPDETLRRMEQAGEEASRVGVELAVELIQKIKPWAQGVYIMPRFHRYDLIAEIIEKLKS